MIVTRNWDGGSIIVSPRKFYAVKLDQALLVMSKLYPNDLGDFNSRLLLANVQHSDALILKDTARFWTGGLPCTKNVRHDDSSTTELMTYDELPEEHKKQCRCVIFPKSIVKNVTIATDDVDLSTLDITTLEVQLARGNRLVDVCLYHELVSGSWKGYRVLEDTVDSEDDSDMEQDNPNSEDDLETRVKRACRRPADEAAQPSAVDDTDELEQMGDMLMNDSDDDSDGSERF